MEQFEKILVPLDGSQHSLQALQQAVYLAELCGAQLELLYVVDLNQKISAFEQVSTGGYIPNELKEDGYEILAAAMQEVPKDIKAAMQVVIGQPSKTIIEFCEQEQCDLIIMGSRGLGKIEQFFMGSVSQYVLSHASCPVMISR
jgi:Universal stress protein UspA and related nucleotide-binding proteins